MGSRSLARAHAFCFRRRFFSHPATKMLSTKLVVALVVAIQLACLLDQAEGMGLCFGGGYPACCSGGKNTCGPFCASCSRVGEFLRHMMMFDMMGFGKGTPAVFSLINPDPHAFPDKRPFPAQPFPVPNNQRPRRSAETLLSLIARKK